MMNTECGTMNGKQQGSEVFIIHRFLPCSLPLHFYLADIQGTRGA